jgi:hypothetical protein
MALASIASITGTRCWFRKWVAVSLAVGCYGQQKAVIREVLISPSTCHLGEKEFDPMESFHVVECATQVRKVSMKLQSPYHLSWADGNKLVMPLQVSLDIGEAKPLSVQACPTSSSDRRSCTSYIFDVYVRESSEAFLEKLMLSVRKGGGIAQLSPAFTPEVTHYVAQVPFASSIEVTAAATKSGYVSFESFQDAERHHVLTKLIDMDASHGSSQIVLVYVSSADMQGSIKYKIALEQLPNTDAGLADIRYSTGILQPTQM